MSVREPGVHVEFVMHPILHGLESKSAGREVFVDKPHVYISVAGMDKDKFFGPVNDGIKQRFPEEWDAFQKGIEAPMSGTVIGSWPHLFSQPSQIKNLLSMGFRTVEDVASASDMALQKVGMGGFKLRDEARKYLSGAQVVADMARLSELEASNAEKDAALDEQRAQIADLQAKVAKLLEQQEPPKRKKAVEA